MNSYEKNKGNVSLPPRLQPPDFNPDKLKEIIVNTQKAFYNLKITETNKRIQRLEERNKELEDILSDTNSSIKVLQEEKSQEISTLKSQVATQVARVEENKKQMSVLENTRIDHKSAHAVKWLSNSEKYDNTRLELTSQLKLLNAKTNVLEDYKSVQQILERKLEAQDEALIHDKEQMSEKLRQIERKFKTDKEKLREELYNRLLDLAGVFQLEVARHMPYSMSKLLSENIAVGNMLSAIMENMDIKKRDYIERRNAAKGYKKKINDERSRAKRFLLVTKLKKSANAKLREIRDKTDTNLSKISKFNYLTEEQYVTNIDNAKNRARQCEARVRYLEILLYREKEKLTIAEDKKQQLINQLEKHTKMLHDIKSILEDLKAVKNTV